MQCQVSAVQSIDTEIYSLKRLVLANQRSERCFSHVKKKNETSNHNRESSFFNCEKNDTSNQKPQRYVSFAPKFLPFIGSCSFQRPRRTGCFADIPREKTIKQSFSRRKVKNISEIRLEQFCIFHYRQGKLKRAVKSTTKRKKQNKTLAYICPFFRS